MLLGVFVIESDHLELFHDMLPPPLIVKQPALPHFFSFDL